MCFTRVPLSLLPLHPQSRPTKNAKNVPLSRCIVDSHGGRIAICNHSLRTMFCNCTFRNVRGGVGRIFRVPANPVPAKTMFRLVEAVPFCSSPAPEPLPLPFREQDTPLSKGRERKKERKGLLKGRQNEKLPFFLPDSSSSRSCIYKLIS